MFDKGVSIFEISRSLGVSEKEISGVVGANNVVKFPTGEEVDLQYNAVEAEQALLGAMLLNNECVNLLVGRIEPKHFYEQLHARIFETITAMVLSGKIANAVTLSPAFRDDSTLKEVGGVAYIGRLMTSAVTVIGMTGYADIVVDAWVRRESDRLITELRETMRYDARGEAVNMLRAQLAAIAEVTNPTQDLKRQRAGVIGEDVIDHINRVHMGEKVAAQGAPCGLVEFTYIFGVWERQGLYLVGARPSMGKTSLATSVMLKSAELGANILYFSMEMSRSQIVERMLSDLVWTYRSPIPYKNMKRGQLTSEEIERIIDANRKLKLLPLVIDDREKLTVEQIRATALAEKQRLEATGKRLDIICIDHGSLIKPSGRYAGNKVVETEEITADLKGMAKTLDCAVICLLQLSRPEKGMDTKRPSMTDLRWSGSWEQDADAVMLLYREAYYLERDKKTELSAETDRVARLDQVKNNLEVIVAKNRMGECRTLEFYTDMGSSVVRDLARH